MPQAVSIIAVPSSGKDASPSPVPANSPAGEAGTAPFAQVLAKASGAGPDTGAGKVAGDRPGRAGEVAGRPNTNTPEGAASADAVMAAMLPVPQGESPGAGREAGEHTKNDRHGPGKDGNTSAKQGGNDLPPLAVSLAAPPPVMVPNAPELRSGVTPKETGSGRLPAPALVGPAGNAAALAGQTVSGATRRPGPDALETALQATPTPSHAGPSLPAAPITPSFAGIHQALSPAGQMTLPLAKDVQSAAPTSKTGVQQSEIPAQGGALFATWVPPVPGSAPQAYQGAVTAPVASPHWGQELGQQLLIGIQGNSQTVTLHVNPPQLGPLQVHLQVTDGQASALFVSPHLAVRQALEGALPQLRDIFAGAGMSLLQTQVSADGGGARRDHPHYAGRATGGVRATEEESMPAAVSWRLGFVNTYV